MSRAGRKGCAVVLLGLSAIVTVGALTTLTSVPGVTVSEFLLFMLVGVGPFLALGCSLWLHQPGERRPRSPAGARKGITSVGFFLAGLSALTASIATVIVTIMYTPFDTPIDAKALEIALNPLFFVGLPLGIYWLYRSTQKGRSAESTPPPAIQIPQEESNPRLTHCPDCGHHVSRLATACPHCGRPLSSETDPQPTD